MTLTEKCKICRQGRFLAIGKDDAIKEQFKSALFDEQIDASGKCIIPGENQYSIAYFNLLCTYVPNH